MPRKLVAMVGGVDIPITDFHAIYALKVKKYADRGRTMPASAERRYRKSITERLIHHELVAQEARRLGVDYDPADLAARQDQQRRGIRDWPKHLERRGESEASLDAMTIASLREAAILEARGELEVTPDDIRADYEKIKDVWKSDQPRIRASHILVTIDHRSMPDEPEPTRAEIERMTAEAKKTAREIYSEVSKPGVDFAEFARRRSAGPSASKGGDIGIFIRDRMVAEFSDVAFSMKVGEISKPVKTKYGFHIIKVTGVYKPGLLPLSALEDMLEDRIYMRKLHQGRKTLRERLLREIPVIDYMAPTLGPEPEPERERSPGQEEPAARMSALSSKGIGGAATGR